MKRIQQELIIHALTLLYEAVNPIIVRHLWVFIHISVKVMKTLNGPRL